MSKVFDETVFKKYVKIQQFTDNERKEIFRQINKLKKNKPELFKHLLSFYKNATSNNDSECARYVLNYRTGVPIATISIITNAKYRTKKRWVLKVFDYNGIHIGVIFINNSNSTLKKPVAEKKVDLFEESINNIIQQRNNQIIDDSQEAEEIKNESIQLIEELQEIEEDIIELEEEDEDIKQEVNKDMELIEMISSEGCTQDELDQLLEIELQLESGGGFPGEFNAPMVHPFNDMWSDLKKDAKKSMMDKMNQLEYSDNYNSAIRIGKIGTTAVASAGITAGVYYGVNYGVKGIQSAVNILADNIGDNTVLINEDIEFNQLIQDIENNDEDDDNEYNDYNIEYNDDDQEDVCREGDEPNFIRRNFIDPFIDPIYDIKDNIVDTSQSISDTAKTIKETTETGVRYTPYVIAGLGLLGLIYLTKDQNVYVSGGSINTN